MIYPQYLRFIRATYGDYNHFLVGQQKNSFPNLFKQLRIYQIINFLVYLIEYLIYQFSLIITNFETDLSSTYLNSTSIMEGQIFFQDGVQQFVLYERNDEQKKTRRQKKRQKTQKMIADFQDPQKKKQRHQIRRNQEKAKLRRELEGLNKQQARIVLDKKKQQKMLTKQKLIKALQSNHMPILIDLVYQKKMNPKENKSLAVQVQLIMKSIKHVQNPPSIHLCSMGGFAQHQLQKMGYSYWTLKSHEQDVVQVAKKMGKKPIYLSPDAPESLEKIQQDTAFVIGGLVDRTVLKNASLMRAQQLQIPAYNLPIRDMMKNRTCLNLDHVVMILCKFKETGDWKEAFEFGAPKRWKKTSQKDLNHQNQQSQQDEQNVQKQSPQQVKKEQNTEKDQKNSQQKQQKLQ